MIGSGQSRFACLHLRRRNYLKASESQLPHCPRSRAFDRFAIPAPSHKDAHRPTSPGPLISSLQIIIRLCPINRSAHSKRTRRENFNQPDTLASRPDRGDRAGILSTVQSRRGECSSPSVEFPLRCLSSRRDSDGESLLLAAGGSAVVGFASGSERLNRGNRSRKRSDASDEL